MGKNAHIQQSIIIIGGMPRSGTTFLYHNIQKHPSIFVPYRKELEFFNYYYDRGFDWYLEHFADMKENQAGFDIGPKYFLDKAVIGRIKSFNPDIKVILGIRDPVEFALSWYAQYSTFNLSMPPFDEFIKSYSLTRLDKTIEVHLTDNLVPKMIEEYRNAFGDNLLMFSYGQFKKDPLSILKAIEAFAGVPAWFNDHNFDNVVINAAGRKNIKIISYILSRERVITMLRVLFPPGLIRFIRSKFDRAGKSSKGTGITSYPKDRVRLAEEQFAEQREYVHNLFTESDLMLGNGVKYEV